MVQTTPRYALPYPEPTDDVNLWEHLEDLATALDAAMAVRACKLNAQTASSIPDGTDTVLAATFAGQAAEEFDPYGWHNVSSNTGRITVDRDGLYQVSATLIYTFNTSLQYADIAVRKNGVVLQRSGNIAPTAGNNVSKMSGTMTEIFQATAGQYFEVSALQNSIGDVAQTLSTGTIGTRFTVRYLGKA